MPRPLALPVCMSTGYSILRKGLTPAGVLHSWFLGSTVFAAFGASGYLLVCLYFIFGTLVGNSVR
jgi:uncharacterized membrane protein